MRRLILTLVGAATVALGVASLASGATVVRCKPGTLTVICTRPVLISPPFGVACHVGGTRVTLPTVRISANAGIRSITITLNGHTIKTFHFKGIGKLTKTISGLAISTAGLSQGLQTVTIVVKDITGKTTRVTRRFTICPPPKFTG